MPSMKRVGAVLALAFVAGCGPRATEKQCQELLVRYTELLTDQLHPKAPSRSRSQWLEQVQQKAKLDPEFRDCPNRVSKAQVECAQDAKNVDEIERCLF
jgi:hypothetical protein